MRSSTVQPIGHVLLFSGLVILLGPASAWSASEPPSFTGLGHLPGQAATFAFGISPDSGVVVGGTSTLLSTRAWRWSASEGMVDLGDLPPAPHAARAMGASWGGERIVGTGNIGCGTSSCSYRAFRWSAAEGLVSLGTLGGTSSWGYAISADGEVVVGYSLHFGGSFRGFRWRESDGMQDLGLPGGYLNVFAEGVSLDGTVVVGHAMDLASTWHAWRWTQADGMTFLGALPGGDGRSYAVAADADGSVVVGRSMSALGMEAYRWTAASGLVGLGELPGGAFESEALAVSGDGSIVVGRSAVASGSGGGAFIWDEVHGMRSLRAVLQDGYGLDLSGWSLSAATGISADGHTIVGFGTNPNGQSEAWRAHLGQLPDITTYCTSQQNSLGCEPRITWSGEPRAGGSMPFEIRAENVLSNQFGLLFYGYGPADVPFGGGTRCVALPLVRTHVQPSGGAPPPIDCQSGAFLFDMGAHIASAIDPNLIAGATVHAQYWSRDPGSPSGTNLTNALRFEIAP